MRRAFLQREGVLGAGCGRAMNSNNLSWLKAIGMEKFKPQVNPTLNRCNEAALNSLFVKEGIKG
jgi:hypothetical protein